MNPAKEKIAIRFLRWFCPPHLVEEIEGDLEQFYLRDEKNFGKKIADRRLMINVLRFLRPGILMRRKFIPKMNHFDMVRNYLTMTLRVSARQKTYSFINILGLSVGLASSILIALYVVDEWGYDKWIANADHIYRVGVMEKFNGEEIWYTNNSAPLAERMQQEIPEIMSTVRISDRENVVVRLGEESFVEKKFFLADSNFFSFFNYPLLEGDPSTCLKGPNKVVLSTTAARKYFNYKGTGDSSPLGKQLLVGRLAVPNEVTGIYKDFPHNTHFLPDIVQSLQTSPFSKSDCWGCYGVKTYFNVVEGASLSAAEAKLDTFAVKHILPNIETDLKISHDQFLKSGDRVEYFIQPLTSIHLYSHDEGEFETNGDIRYVIIFSVISIFIVMIACINFVNLTTARAFVRAKEVGIRKSIGALRSSLIQQFMTESFLYVTLSTLLACGWVIISLGAFNDLTGKSFSLEMFKDFSFLVGGFLFIGTVGILAGAYPSFYLSAFMPVSALKAQSTGVNSRSAFRNSLVVFQFVVSMALVISTLMVFKQLKFIQQQHLGFEQENVLVISQTGALGNNAEAFKNALLEHGEFRSASYAGSLPPDISSTFFVKGEGTDVLVSSYNAEADEDLLITMGFEMKSGRYFSKEFVSDSNAVVINETCARLLGYDVPEGRTVTFGDEKKWHIVGVVKDFNFASLHSSIGPLVLFKFPGREMAIRLSPGVLNEKVDLLRTTWKKFAGNAPLQYSFLDENIEALYRSEQQMGKIFWIFTGMAILIACLGLFGLITFAAGQRKKEIGIRKVLGASVSQVTFLLSADLIRLVIIAFVIAIPITWYGMEQWLQGFVYRVGFDVSSFVIAGVAGVMIAMMTIAFKSFQAASGNPVESLKNE